MKMYLQLVGTVWPMATFPLTFLAAIVFPKRYRWWVLFIAPVLLMLPCILFGEEIAYNGNLLFAVIFGFAVIAWVVYYLVLVIWRIVKQVKSSGLAGDRSRNPAK